MTIDFVFFWFCSDANPLANILNTESNANNLFSTNPFSANSLQFLPFASIPDAMDSIPQTPIPAFAFITPPIVATNLEQFSEQELRLLEGNERHNTEERIKVCIQAKFAC